MEDEWVWLRIMLMAISGISGVELSGSVTTVLVSQIYVLFLISLM
jgi:hypothetical protein